MSKLSSEDRAFLADLAHELKAQDNFGTRKPLFFQIAERRRSYGYAEGYADDYEVVCDDESWESYEEFRQHLIETARADGDEEAAAKLEELGEQPLLGYVPSSLVDGLKEVAEGLGYCDVYLVGYKEDANTISHSPVFLTHREARAYIDLYGYNHSGPHTYCMCSFRSPEYERLLRIVEETDWEADVDGR